MALYRVRWHGELAIQRWKSLLDVAKWQARAGRPLAELWLSGQRLDAVLIERRAQRKRGKSWTRRAGERPAPWWRVWKWIQQEPSVGQCQD
jgi:hypothetical protein